MCVMTTPFLTRVVISNYRSIKACDVRLGSLAFLVGPNGSGKSNFLDAMRLVSESLGTSLDHALRDRGGIKEVRRRSKGHPTHFGIRLEFKLRDGTSGHYAFKIGAQQHGAYEVQEEECHAEFLDLPRRSATFKVESGRVVQSTVEAPLRASKDRLCLANASTLDEFRGVFDGLASMGFYNLNPELIRDVQTPDPGDLLKRDGANLASVMSRLLREDAKTYRRIEQLMERVVPGVQNVRPKSLGHKETLEFKQLVAGDDKPWRFPAANMSDGTLRVLGVLVALFQTTGHVANRVTLVGIEEPEIALHPAAAGALLDGLLLARERTQVLVTSHSPDLLDDDRIPTDAVLAVSAEGGITDIARVDDASRSALRDRLYTAGELLRLNQLQPNPAELPSQLRLFGSEASS
jgi:predicted ATPase